MSDTNKITQLPEEAPDLKEMISRCKRDGNYVWRGQPCIVCYLELKKGMK